MNYEKEGMVRSGRTERRGVANRLLLAAIIALVFAAPAFAQTTATLRRDSIPVGLQPLGIDIYVTSTFSGTATEPYSGSAEVVVANSGDNSVSTINLTGGVFAPTEVSSVVTTQGIPSPYSVAFCPDGNMALVTSPSANSVTALPFKQGFVQTTTKVGSQPQAVACFANGQTGRDVGVVSNVGDNTLMLFDPVAGTILATIPGVPGSHALHGIALSAGGESTSPSESLFAWIAGTNANEVTYVNLDTLAVLTQIPVSNPTAARSGYSPEVVVASAGENSLLTYNGPTLASTESNVPNPQDYIPSNLGEFAIIGGQNALWWNAQNGSPPSTISGIPGAAALAAYIPVITLRSAQGAVMVISTTSNSVYLIQPQPAAPPQFSVSNGASFATIQTASGSLASLFVSTGASQISNAASLPLPNTLGGFALSVGGSLSFSITTGWSYSPTGSFQAGMLFVGPNQINFQIPPGIAPGTAVPAQLTEPNGTTLLTTLNITATAPGIFSVLQNGQGQGAVLNQDNSQNGNPQSIVGANPAARGSVIQIYATGAGATTPSLQPGEPAPASGNPLVLTNVQPTVTIGGVQATVTFSGMAPGYVGLWQINAVVPQSVTPGNAVPLVISAGGATSNTVTIAVQ